MHNPTAAAACRLDVLAGQQDAGHFSKQRTQGHGWNWQHGRPAQDVPEFGRECGVPDGLGGDAVDGAGGVRILDDVSQQADQIAEVNPAEPLSARADPAAEAEAKQRQQRLERPTVAAEHRRRSARPRCAR